MFMKKATLQSKTNLELLLICVPTLILIFVVRYLPMGGLLMAFEKYDFRKGIFGSDFVGFKNFEFFFKSSDAFEIVRNTLTYNILFIVVGTVTAIIFALLLYEVTSTLLVKVYQTIMFFPYFLSWAVVSYIVLIFLAPTGGIVNGVLNTFGIEPIRWYQKSEVWPALFVFLNIWKTLGAATIIYYAGLMGVSSEYFEAASIDGASKLQIIFKIKIPLIMPLISIMFIIAVGGIFYSDFGLFYLVPNSGSNTMIWDRTQVIDTYVYTALKNYGNISMAAAVGFFQSIMGLITVVVANLIVKKINNENSMF